MKLLFGFISIFSFSCSIGHAALNCDDPVQGFNKECQAKLPCEEQSEVFMTKDCIRKYKCAPEKKLPDGVVLVSMLKGKSLIGSLGIKKADSTFATVKTNSLAAFTQAFLAGEDKPSELTYEVDYDGVESEQCYFTFSAKGLKNSGLTTLSSEKDEKIDLTIHSPTPGDLKLFGKTHRLCKRTPCEGGAKEWGLHTLLAVTDFNKNNANEYWSVEIDGNRYWYKAEEYNPKMKAWKKLTDR